MRDAASLPPWNAVRLDSRRPATRDHVESFFIKLNDPSSRRALWARTTLLAKKGAEPVAEAWAVAFERDGVHRAVKQRVLAAAASFSSERLDARVASLELREGSVRGEVVSNGVRIELDLRYEPRAPPLVLFPHPWMYTGPLPSSKLVSPCPDARFSGRYVVDGKEVIVDGWKGMQGHNWGRGNAYRYTWAHCNAFTDEPELIFEGLTGMVKVGPLLAPPLTLLCIRHRGVRYDWSRIRDWRRTRGSTNALSWTFSALNDLGTVEGEIWANAPDFVGLHYENPVGPVTHCLNTKLAHARIRFEVLGRRKVEVSSASAALELGTTDPQHGIEMLL